MIEMDENFIKSQKNEINEIKLNKCICYRNIKLILLLFVLIIFCFLIFGKKGDNKEENNNDIINKKDEEDIEGPQFTYKGKNAYLTDETINRFNSYIKKCQDRNFVNDTIYNISENIKITVIMPVYNRANDLYYSIRSIQYQKMKDIEIILINDGSTDKTLETIQKFKEEDPRIKIINNEKNRRILFSKSMGALYANGKYILELDQDDMFISGNAFIMRQKITI